MTEGLTEENRPKWDFDLPLELFRKLVRSWITRIDVKSKMTSADTSESWLEFHSDSNKDVIKINQVGRVWKLFEFTPNHHAKLIGLTSAGERALKRSEEIAAFDKKHNSEIATYRRLKAKFEGTDQ